MPFPDRSDFACCLSEFDRVELRSHYGEPVTLLYYFSSIVILSMFSLPAAVQRRQLGKVTASFSFRQEIVHFLTKFSIQPAFRPSRGLFPESECKVRAFLRLLQIFEPKNVFYNIDLTFVYNCILHHFCLITVNQQNSKNRDFGHQALT